MIFKVCRIESQKSSFSIFPVVKGLNKIKRIKIIENLLITFQAIPTKAEIFFWFFKSRCPGFFWVKATLKNYGKCSRVHPRWSATFLKLHVGRPQTYKNCTSSRLSAGTFWKFLNQHFGSSLRGCPSLSRYKLGSNRSV